MRVLAALLLSMTCAFAQVPTTHAGKATAGGAAPTYAGPGDVVAGGLSWWGLRAYSAAKAGTKAANICNTADMNCADVNTLANGDFDVATATGAPLNCGGAGGTCTVKTIYDQAAGSPGGINCSAGCDLTQSTIGTRPTLVFNCLGSTKPCMACNGSQNLSASLVGSVTSPFTISAVGKRTGNTSAFSDIFGTASGGVQLLFNSSPNQLGLYTGAFVLGAATDNVFHAVQTISDVSTGTTYIDGSSNSGTSGVVALTIGWTICDNNNPLTGNVTEVGTWPFSFNGTQLPNMNTNQHAYWGF